MKERNANIELLRIISMYMVLVLHALKWGGALEYTQGTQFWFYWGLEALCIVAVDVFMLISGFFQVNSAFKAKNIINIVIEVWIYSVIFSIAAAIMGGLKLQTKDLLQILLPITTKKYWFVNSYLAVYLLSPFINKLIRTISRKQLSVLVVLLLTLFSARVTILPMTWAQDSTGGMSVLWLGTLYTVGAWLSTTGWRLKRNYCHAILFLICAAILVVSKKSLLALGLSDGYATKLYGYPSLIVFIESLMLFLFFAYSKPIRGLCSKVICAVAKHSFSVYIIHFSAISVLFSVIFHLDQYCERVYLFLPWMIVSNLIIFVCCVGIDVIRSNLMDYLWSIPFFQRITAKVDSYMRI